MPHTVPRQDSEALTEILKVRVSPSLDRALRAAAAIDGMKPAEAVRHAVNAYIKSVAEGGGNGD